MIKPVLCYGSEVWRFEISERIENVQIKVCKKFFKISDMYFSYFARGEWGRHPIYIDFLYMYQVLDKTNKNGSK